MKSISFNMLFWYSASFSRMRNVNFTWPRLKKMVEFLKKEGMDCSCNLYDFSEEKILKFPEAVHIPTPYGEFKKSWKINRIIERNDNNEYISMFDADCFVNDHNYKDFQGLLNGIKENEFFVFNLQDVYNISAVNFREYSVDFQTANCRFRHVSTLGPSYVIKVDHLYKVGGFDERFVEWGGEDDDICKRLQSLSLNRSVSSIDLFHLPHELDGAYNSHSSPYYKVQLHILNNDNTVNRGFIKK